MLQKTFSSEGVVLSRKNHGEADRILTVYSKHFGKLKLIAKGVRKPKSKKRGHIEIFSHIKFSVSKNHGFGLITEAELIDGFELVRKDLKKITLAYYMCEVVNKIMNEEEKNELIYRNFLNSLTLIGDTSNLKKVRKEFVANSLISLGFWPYGKEMDDPDKILGEVLERRLNSFHVGKRILS